MNKRLKIIDLIGRTKINEWYKFLQKSQYWSKTEQDAYQNDRLQHLIWHVYKNVPYYKDLFKSLNLTPKDFKTKDDLQKLPVIRRSDLQQNYENLKASNHKYYNSKFMSSGGTTTGEPVRYLSDINTWSLHWALKYRSWETGSYKIGDKLGIMGGASVIPKRKTLKRIIWNKLNNYHMMPSSHMTEEILNNFVSIIKDNNIKHLRGYPSSIAYFSKYCTKNNIELEIKSVITTAEVLQPVYKEEIKQAFNSIIIDSYGCADGDGNANTGPCDCGFHVSFQSAIWEVCTPKGVPVKKNEPGEVTLTSLTNYAMPLLRYQPGDVIENTFNYNKCSCGSSLPRIKSILGRTADILRFQNGRSLGGPAFTLIFSRFSLVKWQMVQNNMDSVDVNIIPAKDFNSVQEQEMSKLMHYHCGEGVSIRINKVDEIKLPQSGKQRIIINNTL
ncbi:MAG: phenylacetate-CoA ligase [Polaribacter sp.]|jgi:phenylacetate-CoA ligase